MTGLAAEFPSNYSAVVIGGGSGIGAGTAKLIAARGVRVFVMDFADSEQTATQIREAGGDAESAAVDVTDTLSLERAFALAFDWSDQVHAVINTAGVQGELGTPSHKADITSFERTLSVNLTASVRIAHAVIPHMLEHGYGRIAHVSSIAGKEGNPNMVAYSASKAGLIGVVKTQGKEYAGTGITVNAIAPAVIRTPFLDTQDQATLDYMTARIPMGRVGEIDEVGEMLAFMISPACSFTTGFTFDLSGGRATY